MFRLTFFPGMEGALPQLRWRRLFVTVLVVVFRVASGVDLAVTCLTEALGEEGEEGEDGDASMGMTSSEPADISANPVVPPPG